MLALAFNSDSCSPIFLLKDILARMPLIRNFHAILALRSLQSENFLDNVCDEDMLLECLDKDDVKAFQDIGFEFGPFI